MFIGQYSHTLDGKNRVTVPKKLIEAIGDADQRKQFVIAPGYEDGSLFMFTEAAFEELADSLDDDWLSSDEHRRFQRKFFGSAERAALDSVGRMVIPERHRKRAGIIKEVTFVGLNKRIEIWSSESWTDEENAASEDYVEVAKKMTRTPKPK